MTRAVAALAVLFMLTGCADGGPEDPTAATEPGAPLSDPSDVPAIDPPGATEQ